MNYYSTRNHQHIVSAAQAIACGLAPDGGLFVPEALPAVSAQQLQALCSMTYQQRAVTIMRPFLSEFTDDELARFTAAAYGSQFDDPAVAPVHRLDDAINQAEAAMRQDKQAYYARNGQERQLRGLNEKL